MKKLFFFTFLLLICRYSFAQEIYAVEREDGGVSIVYYNEHSEDSIEQVIKDMGFENAVVRKIKESDMPKNREDRNLWKISSKKIVVDTFKKQEESAEKAIKDSEKSALLSKLNINSQEAKTLKEVLNDAS